MREITITRHKSFVGCLAKVKFYIADPNTKEITICGVPCRKLGAISNGKSATFEIPEEEVTIFAIIDKLTKNYCVDKIVIPAGNTAIAVSGKNKFNFLHGNPFVFDKN